MDESILTSIKRLLGITEDYQHFDQDLIMHINSVLMTLTQIGVGPVGGMLITDDSTTWEEFAGEVTDLGGIQSYVYLKVKLLFDPPQTSSVTEAINRQINELEWRLNFVVDK